MGTMDVVLSGLGKSYDGDTWAVDDLNLEIDRGSIFGLIGPNGAGKSSTLRMMAAVMEPTRGSITMDGVDVTGADPKLRGRIGFLGDGNPLYKQLTAREYLRFFGQCYGLDGAELETRIEDTLVSFRLQEKGDAICRDLSKGMRQRLLVARCLLHRPQLLILDEPADGLDPRGRSELRRVLKDIQATGTTIVISSHILRELDDLCDRVAILQRGRLVVSGPVDQIIERYEVGRLVYELRILDGLEAAQAVLARHRALVEETVVVDGLQALRIQVQGDESLMADIVSDLVGNGVRLVTSSRVRSRLEDVYERISEDRVN